MSIPQIPGYTISQNGNNLTVTNDAPGGNRVGFCEVSHDSSGGSLSCYWVASDVPSDAAEKIKDVYRAHCNQVRNTQG